MVSGYVNDVFAESLRASLALDLLGARSDLVCGLLCSALLPVFFLKQKTAYEIVDCDWSSDVCSSDLHRAVQCLCPVLQALVVLLHPHL